MSFTGTASGAGALSQPPSTIPGMGEVDLAAAVPQPGGGAPVEPRAAVPRSIEAVASRLAGLLLGGQPEMADPSGSELVFEPGVVPEVLGEPIAVPEVWAIDGGQSLVADARCLQVYVTRAATVCFRDGWCAIEEVGDLHAHLLGAGGAATGLASAGLQLEERTPIDVNLLRDWEEWSAARLGLERAAPGSLLLIDGDLIPDWRVPPTTATELFEVADQRDVTVMGVTKHSSLSRGGAPLVGQLELEAAAGLGRGRWWAPVARTRSGSHWPDLQVLVAGLDPDARYSFRIDVPSGRDAETALRKLASVSNDAAFPGYPYPLSVADRLAACPGWVRAEAWLSLDEALDKAGVADEARQRAFDDRHRLMERA
jgi:hypothetical protein